MPAVSVIVPVYNMETYVGECLDSVLRQTLADLEVIIINDGSTDGSLKIIQEYQKRDHRIVVIDKKNAGVGAARNDGIRAATGEFLAFIDPDDMYASDDALLHCYQAAKREDVPVAGGRIVFLYQDGSRKEEVMKQVSNITFSAKGLTEYKDYQCDYGYVCYLYKRELLIHNQIFFPLYRRFQDPPFFVQAMIAANRFYALDEPVYLYRQLPGAAKLTAEKTLDFLEGIMDNLRVSKESDLAQLHYITAERLNTEGSYMALHNLESPDMKKILVSFIQATAMVDTVWLEKEGYLASTWYLPEVFDYTVTTAAKYEKLRKNKCLRVLLRIRSRLSGGAEKMNDILELVWRAEHKIYRTIKRMRLKNKSMTVLSSNCNGSYMLHDLGCPFNSPTVNLYFLPEHFLKFVRNPQKYLEAELREVHLPDIAYPVGQLNDIYLFFMHYGSFAEAKAVWERRAKRVDLNNVYVVMTDKDGCTYEHIRQFEELPYKNKVIFTHVRYPEFASAYYIPGFENENEVGVLSDWKPQRLRRRWLDDFDYVRFFNQENH